MAELFDDHSPLQLMASGRITLDGKEHPFTLIGRLQYKTEAGVWTEWIAFCRTAPWPAWAKTTAATSSPAHGPGASCRGQPLSRGQHHRHQRQALQRGLQRPGQPDLGPGRTAQTAGAGPARSTWSSCAAQTAKCSASTTATSHPRRTRKSVLLEDLQLQGLGTNPPRTKRPPVQLPALRRARAGTAEHHQKHHLRLVRQHHRPQQRRGRRAALGRAGRARAPHHPAGQQGPAPGRALAGGGFPAPHGRGAGRRRALWLERIPALQPEARFCLSGRCRRRLEHGATHHRRPANGGQRTHRQIHGQHLPAQVHLRGRNHLRAGRVLLAGRARAKPPTAISPVPRACCRWSRARTS